MARVACSSWSGRDACVGIAACISPMSRVGRQREAVRSDPEVGCTRHHHCQQSQSGRFGRPCRGARQFKVNVVIGLDLGHCSVGGGRNRRRLPGAEGAPASLQSTTECTTAVCKFEYRAIASARAAWLQRLRRPALSRGTADGRVVRLLVAPLISGPFPKRRVPEPALICR